MIYGENNHSPTIYTQTGWTRQMNSERDRTTYWAMGTFYCQLDGISFGMLFLSRAFTIFHLLLRFAFLSFWFGLFMMVI